MLTSPWMRVVALVLWLAVAGCGGGGGGDGGNEPVPGTLNVTFTPGEVAVSNVEGQFTTTTVHFTATLSYTGTSDFYLFIGELNGVVSDVDATLSGNQLTGYATLTTAIAPGVHDTELLLQACLDPQCNRELGSPFRLPIRHEVLPNIGMPTELALRRAGREPAPQAVVPVSVPAAAGQVSMQLASSTGTIDVSFDGSQLLVSTRQLRAGRYIATVDLRSQTDPRYRRTLTITYTVDPPPGGERELSVSPQQFFSVPLEQGQVTTRRFKVNRPTWTDVLDPPVVTNDRDIMTLRDLGNDEYEVTLDSRGREPTTYQPRIRWTAGPTGGEAGVSFFTTVSSAFYAENQLVAELGLNSGPAELRKSTRVMTFDGVPQRWSASTSVPWLRLLTTQGTTGVDSLEVEIDAAALPGIGYEVGEVLLSIDRPGTTTVAAVSAVRNSIPYLQFPSVRTLVGDRGRVYIEGRIRQVFGPGSILGSGALKVDGARLVDAQLINDNRFVGDMLVLRTDLADAVPGRDITIRLESPLMSSQVVLSVEAPGAVPAGYLPLPLGSYRPPQYSAGRNAVFFAGGDTVYRWTHDGASWRVDSVALPGVIDVALRPDERVLYAISGAVAVQALDPDSLAATGQGALHQVAVDFDRSDFDPQARAGMRALAYSADFRAFGSKRGSGLDGPNSGVDWLLTATMGNLLDLPRWGGPGFFMETIGTGPVTSSGIVRSPGGHALLAQHPGGTVRIYRPESRAWGSYGSVPAATTLAAVSDDASRTITSDGVLRIPFGNQSLAGLVPPTHVAGGYGLTADGQFVLVYGYRIATEQGLERARDATLWVFDASGDLLQPIGPAQLLAALPMSDAVGCVQALATGETCRHDARIAVDEQGHSAFVLGPRGLAAVPLPPLASARAAADRARAGRAGAGNGGRARAQRILRVVP
jgi:hypothetical protein